jgi:hypothetical protein
MARKFPAMLSGVYCSELKVFFKLLFLTEILKLQIRNEREFWIKYQRCADDFKKYIQLSPYFLYSFQGCNLSAELLSREYSVFNPKFNFIPIPPFALAETFWEQNPEM